MEAAIAQVRAAVGRLLGRAGAAGLLDGGALGVAVSGGADSLALAAAAEQVAHRSGLTVHGLIVDHGLQPGSADVAASTAGQLRRLGLDRVRVLPVSVEGPGGPEAAARRTRYAALGKALPNSLVLLGHTRDDQAETVLLGLGRGSGPRSIAGMRPLDPPWARPFLDLSRATTRAACAALGLQPWQDPHNDDPRFTRVRLRHEVLPLLEAVLQGGVAGALARTATQLREDAEALDVLAAELGERVGAGAELEVAPLARVPAAVRRRVLRNWLLDRGVAELSDAHIRAVDALIGEWRGQGGVWLPGGLEASRAHGRLRVSEAAHRGRTVGGDEGDEQEMSRG
jgi:tRNA(Ile)-lysidine synthase